MRELLKVALLGGAAYAAALLFTNSKANVNAGSLAIRLTDIDIDWQRIRLTLQISNPTTGNIIIRSIIGDLYVNGTIIGKVLTQGYHVINANGTLQLPVNAQLSLGPAVQTYINSLRNREPLHIDFVGSINLNNQLMPVRLKWDWNV
jgi:LEA14-like dessication related protein